MSQSFDPLKVDFMNRDEYFETSDLYRDVKDDRDGTLLIEQEITHKNFEKYAVDNYTAMKDIDISQQLAMGQVIDGAGDSVLGPYWAFDDEDVYCEIDRVAHAHTRHGRTPALKKMASSPDEWSMIQLYRYFYEIVKQLPFKDFTDPIFDDFRKDYDQPAKRLVKFFSFNLTKLRKWGVSSASGEWAVEYGWPIRLDPLVLTNKQEVYKNQRNVLFKRFSANSITKLIKYMLPIYDRYMRKKLSNTLKKKKFVDPIKNKLWSPGHRLSSNMVDKLLQDAESKSIEDLVHCKKITHTELLSMINLLALDLDDDSVADLMVNLISEYGSKYNVEIDEGDELTMDQLKKISKRILLRIQKYDLCRFIDDNGYTSLLKKEFF